MTGCCECGNEFWITCYEGNFLISSKLLASQEGLCSVKLVGHYFAFRFSLWTNLPAGETALLKTSTTRRLYLLVLLNTVSYSLSL